ncbi:MAG TPA: hypothetical protein VMR45_04565 [Patescibacteria group bacterium]|nr:hypothetical protein [Patescibacteria group bacterium]
MLHIEDPGVGELPSKSRRVARVATVAGAIVLAGSLMASSCDGPSFNVGNHVLTEKMDCNNQTTGLNKVIVSGGSAAVWAANIVKSDGIGVGVSQNSKGQFVASRVTIASGQQLYNYSPVASGTEIDTYSLRFNVYAGPEANQITAVCQSPDGSDQKSFKTPVPTVAVP